MAADATPSDTDAQAMCTQQPTAAGQRRVRVLWLIKGLGPGGAERLLLEHARLGNHDTISYEVAYLLPGKQHLVPAFEELGVATHCLDVRTPADPRWLGRLRRLVRNGHFDVVHVHSPAIAAGARPALRASRRPPALVYTEHNRWPSHHVLTRLGNRMTMRLDDATIAVSNDVRASMGRAGDRAQVVFHGIDVKRVREYLGERDAVRAALDVAPHEILAVTVANLRRDKGYRHLLAAARAVVDEGLPIRFAAAGQGPQEEELRVLHASLALGDRFRLLGYVPDAARVTAAADLFVLASLHEGLPVAIMEAFALGVPVVATRTGGVPELVEHDRSGLLVEPGDPEALAAAIREAADAETRAKLAEGARLRGARIDGRATVTLLEDLYCSLAGQHASHGR